jgi:tryptophan-rich sensory protein
MHTDHPWIWAIAICAAAALLEGACSGSDVKRRFAELSLPKYSPPLWAWALIGAGFYIIHLIVLHALLAGSSASAMASTAVFAVAVLLTANAAWNYLFFRKHSLAGTVILNVPYIALAAAIGTLLWLVARGVATLYLLYLLYLPYMAWWTYAVWRHNPSHRANG